MGSGGEVYHSEHSGTYRSILHTLGTGPSVLVIYMYIAGAVRTVHFREVPIIQDAINKGSDPLYVS